MKEKLIEIDVDGLQEDEMVRLVEALSEALGGEEFCDRVAYLPPHVERSRFDGSPTA
jgi:hypothetical protein